MNEYIEREAARNLMEQALYDDWEIQYFNDRLDEIPAADVAPVRHALWIKHGKPNVLFWSCSRCGQVERDMTPYCCSCGAKMDGGKT